MRRNGKFTDRKSQPIKCRKTVEQKIPEKRRQNGTGDAEKDDLGVKMCVQEPLTMNYEYLNLKTFQVR